MTLAADARAAARDHPFLLDALRADVVNYTAAADFLGLDGERDAVATALRRFAEEVDDYETERRTARVTMQSGIGLVDADGESDAASDDHLAVVGGNALVADAGNLTAVLATGDVDAAELVAVLRALAVAEIDVEAAAVGSETLLVVVGRRDGGRTVRTVEDALSSVPV